MPKGVAPIDYVCSFAEACGNDAQSKAALLGVKDSLRQAALIPFEPLGMFACITAEEEASTFLYLSILNKGYRIPDFRKLRNHRDKVKFLLFAEVLVRYFFDHWPKELAGVVRIERDIDKIRTNYRFRIGDYVIVQEDPLASILSVGQGETGHDAAVQAAVDAVLSEFVPKGFTVQSYIKNIANRRNLCLYGDPSKKSSFQSFSEIQRFSENCVVMIVLGFLVKNSNAPTASMRKLAATIFERIAT